VNIDGGTCTRNLPLYLFCSVSGTAKDHFITGDKYKNNLPNLTLHRSQSWAALNMFNQWLYIGKYTKLLDPVVSFDNTPLDLTLERDEEGTCHMDWSVKAAIMAWELGHELAAPAFQNHAMTRHFAALARG
jgi:hypothetical protein